MSKTGGVVVDVLFVGKTHESRTAMSLVDAADLPVIPIPVSGLHRPELETENGVYRGLAAISEWIEYRIISDRDSTPTPLPSPWAGRDAWRRAERRFQKPNKSGGS